MWLCAQAPLARTVKSCVWRRSCSSFKAEDDISSIRLMNSGAGSCGGEAKISIHDVIFSSRKTGSVRRAFFWIAVCAQAFGGHDHDLALEVDRGPCGIGETSGVEDFAAGMLKTSGSFPRSSSKRRQSKDVTPTLLLRPLSPLRPYPT